MVRQLFARVAACRRPLLWPELQEEGGAASALKGRDMTGDELKAQRKRRDFSRLALAMLAGVHPDTVRYWERRAIVDLRGWAPDRLLHAMGLGELSQKGTFPGPRFVSQQGISSTLTRARGGVLAETDKSSITTRGKRRCGAKTRKGTPCRAKPLPDKTRCRFHGGLSTGPKTLEGRERIAEAQRRRWARWQANRAGAS